MSKSKDKGTLAERLWARVEPPDQNGCREWAGYVDKKTGYGQIGRGARSEGHIGTHVAAWLVTYGPIPAGQSVLHRCDNRPCCEPSHLFIGTQTDNVADMKAKGRARGATGTSNGNARITDAQVADIRRRYRQPSGRGKRDGNTHELAQEFGVTAQYIGQIARGTWRASS